MNNPNFPRYVSPQEKAETRARIRAFIIWSAVGLVVFVLAMLFAYTDQAPGWMRAAAFAIDGVFGYPVLGLIRALMA